MYLINKSSISNFEIISHYRDLCYFRVTFPDILNLNSFISSTTSQESPGGEEDIGLGIKCDDSSTTDSGTLDDDCAPCDNSLSNSNHSASHDQDDDEGNNIMDVIIYRNNFQNY